MMEKNAAVKQNAVVSGLGKWLIDRTLKNAGLSGSEKAKSLNVNELRKLYTCAQAVCAGYDHKLRLAFFGERATNQEKLTCSDSDDGIAFLVKDVARLPSLYPRLATQIRNSIDFADKTNRLTN